MLEQLSIENYALIENLSVDFSKGLNILTGETGAGKSIIVGALSLLLGERADVSSIRKGAETCVVNGIFDLSKNESVRKRLEEQNINIDDNSLLLRREINIKGKNRCLVNGQMITLGMLKNIGTYLVDLHGQHEHQAILQPQEQMDILDDFGKLMELRNKVKMTYEKFEKLQGEYHKLLHNEKERASRIDLNQFQKEEIENAHLSIDEDEKLDKRITLLTNAEKIYGLLEQIYQKFYEEEGAVFEKLNAIKKDMEKLSLFDSDFERMRETIEANFYSLEDVHTKIKDYKEKVEFDPQKLEELQERKEQIKKLKHKYGNSIEEIFKYYDKIISELTNLANMEENRTSLEKEIEKIRNELREYALKLSEERKKVAINLEKEVETELKDLGLVNTKFKINLKKEKDEEGKEKIGEFGCEIIQFFISPNIGEDLKPLAQIASGGEMSRIMLGIKTVLARSDKIPTLIFDEIDTGVGGDMSRIVGNKLHNLSNSHQLICITHWPQIAGFAQTHFKVEKEVKQKRTATTIKELKDQERLKEIARMLGGEKLTEISLKHAKEMIYNKSRQ